MYSHLPMIISVQTPKAPGASLCNIGLAMETPSATTMGYFSGTSSDMQKHGQSQHIKWRLLERVELIKAAVGRSMALAKTKFKHEYDKKARLEPQICAGDEVYVDGSQHIALVSASGEEFARRQYYKLSWHTGRPYEETELQSHRVVSDEDGTPYKVRFDRVTPN